MSDSRLPSFGQFPPGFIPVATLAVARAPSGMFFVSAKEYRGMTATGRTLMEALLDVPGAFADLLAAGAVIPSLGGVELPSPHGPAPDPIKDPTP